MSAGLADARHVIVPGGIVSSGFPAVRDTCAQLGLGFDSWQGGAARCILAKTADGLYAADTVVLSIPRQVGKTYLVALLVFADAIINPGATTVWTAHRFKVARETFNQLKAIALAPSLAPHIDPDGVTTAAGNEAIVFRNGSRIMFAARERGTIRGFSNVRRLILDEGQILTEQAMADLAPTMNQATNPQMVLMGTPPKPTDPSETFTGLREEALSGKSEGLLYIECSADSDADLDDRQAWRQANLSYPHRTPERAIVRLRKLLASEDDFAREALGIWGGSRTGAVIDPATWAQVADVDSLAVNRMALAVDVDPDRTVASVALAGQRADGLWHVELDEQRKGVGWLVPYLQGLLDANPGVRAVVIDQASPAATVIDELGRQRLRPTTTNTREYAAACGQFYDGVHEQWLRHIDQPQVNAALSAARKRPLGDAWAWNRKNAASDITPVVAATLALHGAQAQPAKVKRPGRRARGQTKVRVMT